MTYDNGTPETSNISLFPTLRIQKIGSNEPNSCAVIRMMAVEDAAVAIIVGGATMNGPWKPNGARLVASIARRAWERQRHIVSYMGGQAWGFQIFADELEELTGVEAMLGTNHPEAQRELERLDALPCRPFVDEVTSGAFRAVTWMADPGNWRRFDLSGEEGV